MANEKTPGRGADTRAKSRIERARAELRQAGFNILTSCPGPNASALEFWTKGATTLILQLWPDEGGSACYFSDGNPTWEEWRQMLTAPRVEIAPKAQPPPYHDRPARRWPAVP